VSIPDATGDEAYTYDVYKHPLTATKNDRAVSYVYDGLGRRIAEQEATGTAFILWDGSQLAAYGLSRTDASNWVLEVGGADIDEHIASVNLGRGTVRIYHQTIDGSVIGVSDGTGLLEGYSYSAYGEVTFRNPDSTPRTDTAVGTRFLYHGQLFDPYTRTYSMRAREYRPTWGRFLSTDPIGLDGGLNLYAFVNGAPLHMRDPMGTHADPLKDIDTFEQWLDLANEAEGGRMADGYAALFYEMSAIDPKMAVAFMTGDEATAMAALDAYHDAVERAIYEHDAARINELASRDHLTWGEAHPIVLKDGKVLEVEEFIPLIPAALGVLLLEGAAEGAVVEETASAALTRFVAGVDVTSFGKVVASGTADLGPTIDAIENGTLTPRSVFSNREGLLPPSLVADYYQEYVVPNPGVSGVGSQRIVQGMGGEMYYTPDHYQTFIPLSPGGG